MKNVKQLEKVQVRKHLRANIFQFDGEPKLTFEQVKAFLEANKDNADLQAFYKTSVVTPDAVKDYIGTFEGKKAIQPVLDSHFTNSLNTWKTNNLDKLVSEEIAKRNPSETPEQKRIRELEEKLEQREKAEVQSQLQKAALKFATDNGFEGKFATKWADRFLGENEEATAETLKAFKADYDEMLKAAVDVRFKASGREPEQGGGGGSTGNVDIAKLAGEVSLFRDT